MPFQVQTGAGPVRLTLRGHVSMEELHGLLAAMDAIERDLRPVPDRLTDLTEMTDADITMDEMRQVVARRLSTRFPNPFRSAIVAPQEFQLGYARMFQILNDHSSITINIFRTVAEAEQWLAEEPARPAPR